MTAKELVDEALAKARKANALKSGKIMQAEKDYVAYNVEDTTGEPRPAGEGPNWDDYWKYWTNEKFTGATCACCGCALSADIRVGAHVRLAGETDNTKNAWIALYCKSCNNQKDKKERKVRKDSWIVKTVMSEAHKNVKPE